MFLFLNTCSSDTKGRKKFRMTFCLRRVIPAHVQTTVLINQGFLDITL